MSAESALWVNNCWTKVKRGPIGGPGEGLPQAHTFVSFCLSGMMPGLMERCPWVVEPLVLSIHLIECPLGLVDIGLALRLLQPDHKVVGDVFLLHVASRQQAAKGVAQLIIDAL
jgi:hypothetical protein